MESVQILNTVAGTQIMTIEPWDATQYMNLTLTNVSICNNTNVTNGLLNVQLESADVTITGLTLSANTASKYIFIVTITTGNLSMSGIRILDNVIYDNTSTTCVELSVGGGALYMADITTHYNGHNYDQTTFRNVTMNDTCIDNGNNQLGLDYPRIETICNATKSCILED